MLLSMAGGLFLFESCRKGNKGSKIENDSYSFIDHEIELVPKYEEVKEKKIQEIKQRISREKSNEARRELTDWLIMEYEAYISDSALFYINKNLQNPSVMNDPVQQTKLLIKKADVAAHAGLFGEAAEILEGIDKSVLDSIGLEAYYSAYCDLYQYQSEYATDSEYGDLHGQLRELYIDSVGMVAPPSSINYVMNRAASMSRNGNFAEAEKLLLENLNKYKSGERNYSILASILADTYKKKGDEGNFHKYISESVVSDIRGAIKENMAIRALAIECFEEGDIERADRYLRQSFADANFYTARMRNAQSSRMLPIIGESYTESQKSLNHQLRVLVVFMSILAFGFILISIFAFMQVKKVRGVNRKTKEMLDEVSQLSKKLKSVNEELSKTNEELKNSNAIQGEYGVLFMEYCSLAISALQQYQMSLKVVANQGNIQNLIKKIESSNIENKTLAEFYSKFDEAVLNIYPNFVDKFNALLRPEERIELKPKESLNTELRLFALIRIGINDSEKIANFLRCSLSTVYTYRSKTKKKAISPDTFETDLLTL